MQGNTRSRSGAQTGPSLGERAVYSDRRQALGYENPSGYGFVRKIQSGKHSTNFLAQSNFPYSLIAIQLGTRTRILRMNAIVLIVLNALVI